MTLPTIRVKVEWKPQDCWIGLFWKRFRTTGISPYNLAGFDAWLCLLPMVPIHLYVNRKVSGYVEEP